MEEENRVTLHGMWASPYSKRVELALKLKGIPYEYVEEDLMNKSPLLLKYNPVHKMVPIFLHNGKSISESLVIIEYIDETWKNGPQLLPEDPYKRSQLRFWGTYIQQQLFEAMLLVLKREGEAQQKAIKEAIEKLEVLEEGVKGFFSEGTPFCGGKNLGFLDIVICSLFGSYKAHEEGLGMKVIDPEKTPLIFSWVTSLTEHPLVKEIQVPHEKLVGLLQFIRQKALTSSAA